MKARLTPVISTQWTAPKLLANSYQRWPPNVRENGAKGGLSTAAMPSDTPQNPPDIVQQAFDIQELGRLGR
ncbi:MAG TPA: hypothetical protein QF564_27845 [Pirellulaceae bacterium]|nr:hypothetical protein [Pirellulaceae bacterium]